MTARHVLIICAAWFALSFGLTGLWCCLCLTAQWVNARRAPVDDPDGIHAWYQRMLEEDR